MNWRMEIYRQLVRNDQPDKLQTLWEKLDLYHCEEELNFQLSSSEIKYILERYLSGSLSEQQVEDWANFIEVISYEIGGIGDEAMEIIHRLANPVLEGPLTQMRAQRLVALLEKGMPAEEQIDKAYP